VRELVQSTLAIPVSLIHGRAEVIAAIHRRFREGRLDELGTAELIGQFTDDCDAGLFTWVPLTGTIISRVTAMYLEAPATLFLRAGDCAPRRLCPGGRLS
jgi:hypothetical protein